MKKTYSLILLLIVILIIFSGYKLLSKEKESNQNEQTTESETSSLKTYNNPEVGFSFQYPSEMIFLNEDQYNRDPEKTYLKVDLKKIGEQEKPMDLDKEEEMNNIEVLNRGEFGITPDFSLPSSQKVKSVGFLFAQDYLVLSRFEICNVTLERKLLFYFNNQQITITSFAPLNKLKETMSEYFTINNENCGQEKIWDFEKQDQFYNKLTNQNGSPEIQKWFNDFDQLSEAIIFAHR